MVIRISTSCFPVPRGRRTLTLLCIFSEISDMIGLHLPSPHNSHIFLITCNPLWSLSSPFHFHFYTSLSCICQICFLKSLTQRLFQEALMLKQVSISFLVQISTHITNAGQEIVSASGHSQTSDEGELMSQITYRPQPYFVHMESAPWNPDSSPRQGVRCPSSQMICA